MRIWVCLLTALLLLGAPPAPGLGAGPEGGGQWATGRAPSDLGVYHTYAEMLSGLQNLTARHPEITRLVPLRQTYENRTLWAVKLSDNPALDEAEPNISFLGGIHARELIGVEVPLYILTFLADGYSTNASIKRLVDGSQMWFVPMLNPDGHVYVEQGSDWRKNRRPTGGGNTGVDLNRNFGHLWGQEASRDPAAEDYCGPGPFSENETQAVRDLVTAHPMTAAISYHSFGPYILYPWGNLLDQSAVDPRLPALALNMSLAMPEGRRYTAQEAWRMYPATGDTDDWFYANLSMLAFTVELSVAYRPPDSEVPGICSDNLPAALCLMEYCVPRHDLSLSGSRSFGGPPGASLELNFTLANTGNADETVELGVTCQTAPWSLELGQGPFILRAGANASVPIRVLIPANATAFQTMSLVYRAVAESGASARAELSGTVEQVRRLSVSLTLDPEVSPDTTVEVTASIKNLGNGPESLSLAAGTGHNWLLEPPLPYPFNLSAWEERNLSMNLTVPVDALAGPAVFSFKAYDLEGLPLANDSRPLTILSTGSLTLDAEPGRLKLREREKINVTIVLRNTGNGWENGTLNLSGSYSQHSFGNLTLNVSPRSNATVNFSVEGRGSGGNMTLEFSSAAGERLAAVNISVEVTPGAAANDTNGTMPANAVLVLILASLVFLATMAFVYWETRHGKNGGVGKPR